MEGTACRAADLAGVQVPCSNLQAMGKHNAPHQKLLEQNLESSGLEINPAQRNDCRVGSRPLAT